jgi:hypothetical protein
MLFLQSITPAFDCEIESMPLYSSDEQNEMSSRVPVCKDDTFLIDFDLEYPLMV